MKRTIGSLLFAGLLLTSPGVLAQSAADKATARTLGQQGSEALDAKDFAKALDLFGRANSLFHAPTLSLGLARAQAGSGKLVAALETYNALVREGPGASAIPAFVQAVEDAKKEAAAIEPKIGKVVLTLSGPKEAQVTVDGEAFPSAALGIERPIDPGKHEAKATANGFEPAAASFVVAEGAGATVVLTLKASAAAPPPPVVAPAPALAPAPPPPAPPPPAPPAEKPSSTQRTLGWVSLGIGGAGLVAGAITGALALGYKGTLDTDCKPVCAPTDTSTHDSYETVGAISTATFIGGGAFVALGGILVLTSPSTPSQPARGSLTPGSASGLSFSPWFGPGSAGMRGTF